MNITTVIGARPQFVKAAVVSRAFKEAGINEFLIHTGQHYAPSLSEVFLPNWVYRARKSIWRLDPAHTPHRPVKS